jgi:hypothetical protein
MRGPLSRARTAQEVPAVPLQVVTLAAQQRAVLKRLREIAAYYRFVGEEPTLELVLGDYEVERKL